MKMILGIDTGGTYTDAVILTVDQKKIVYQNKILTTHQDLSVCIGDIFSQIPADMRDRLVSVNLSTTLATNAIVEGKGARAGLILIGKKPEGIVPAEHCVLLEGQFDIKGREIRPMKSGQLQKAILALRGKVDAIAVSGYASVRNPSHEIYTAEQVQKYLDLPVVCAHELSSKLGFYDRTVTVVLNARLIPLILDLIQAVRIQMLKTGIHAPLMIVRGDGTLMTAGRALHKPIETLLSGPAASVSGGRFLSRKTDALIIDIGGTTTDVAKITAGEVHVRTEGAMVGGYLTQIRAAEIYTAGLGGDSRISLSPESERNKSKSRISSGIIIGPERIVPACRSSAKGAGFTPTDLLHCMRALKKWDAKASDAALEKLAEANDISAEDLTEKIRLAMCERMAEILETAENWFSNSQVGNSEKAEEGNRIPLVFVGAPAKMWCERIFAGNFQDNHLENGYLCSDLLSRLTQNSREVIVPEYADTANAIGAAVGKETEQIELLIRKDSITQQFLVYTPFGRDAMDTLEAATDVAVRNGEKYFRTLAEEKPYKTKTDIHDLKITSVTDETEIFIERQICMKGWYQMKKGRVFS